MRASSLSRVSDGVIYRVLAKLMVLNGERLSYRILDVEHIGSVYEAMMGFTLLRAPGPMIAVKPAKAHGAAVMVDLAALLQEPAPQRARWLKNKTEQTLTEEALAALQTATTQQALLVALAGKIAVEVTPETVPAGALVLQPTDERRRTGSHYTPPDLSRPMVKEALRPVLARLGENPTPVQILNLKVCDPAMGSGAFLVETCKQLAEALVAAWRAHRCTPALPPDEDEALHARRLVAQRCLYGVDKNPRAVELAQLSLWLVTLAKEHLFTFLDHALKCGDSLLGVRKLRDLDWFYVDQNSGQRRLAHDENWLEKVTNKRRELGELPENVSGDLERKHALLEEAEVLAWQVRLLADVLTGARLKFAQQVKLNKYLQAAALSDTGTLQQQARKFLDDRLPFHWPVEFPEVFGRDNPGFDVIVGNPPFVGGRRITGALGTAYRNYLIERIADGRRGSADLCAYFFLRAGQLVRDGGMMALLATNTIAQGDTREVGLDQLTAQGFSIPRAVPSVPWPGEASLEVAQVWLYRGAWPGAFVLDGQPVAGITPFLTVPGQVIGNPYRLAANANKSFIGSVLSGIGFVLTPIESVNCCKSGGR